jgi:hypothetical protein
MMAAPSWMLTVVLVAVAGPHAALDSSWIWWLGDPSSVPAGVGETNDGPSSAGIDSTSGLAFLLFQNLGEMMPSTSVP